MINKYTKFLAGIFIPLWLIFFSCLGPDESSVEPEKVKISRDTSLVDIESYTSDSSVVMDTILSESKDSVYIFQISVQKTSIDSIFNIYVTVSRADQDSVDTLQYEISGDEVNTDTVKIKSYAVESSATVHDTVVFKIESADTVFVESDTIMILDIETITDTTIYSTKTSVFFDVDDGENIIRTFSAQTFPGSDRRQDTIYLYQIVSKDSGVVDTVIAVTDTSQSDIFQDNLKITETIRKSDVIVRTSTVFGYKYISSSWIQDMDGNWMEAVDTTEGVFHAPVKSDSSSSITRILDTFNLAENMVIATTSDYYTGSYSAVTLKGNVIQKNIAPIHSDSKVRFFGGDDIYIINSFGRDNIQVLNRKTLKTTLQFGLPAFSNPHDLLEHEGRLYAILYGKNSIQVHDRNTGSLIDEINISKYAKDSDSLAEAESGVFIGDNLYVIVQNLDQNNFWQGTKAKIIKINIKTGEQESANLPFQNPADISVSENDSLIYISCTGAYGINDGGIISVDPDDFGQFETVLTEAEAGGDLGKIILWKNSILMIVSSMDGDYIMSSPVPKINITKVSSTSGWALADMALDAEQGILYMGDREKGLRLFNLADFSERSRTNIKLGMPISSLAVVR